MEMRIFGKILHHPCDHGNIGILLNLQCSANRILGSKILLRILLGKNNAPGFFQAGFWISLQQVEAEYIEEGGIGEQEILFRFIENTVPVFYQESPVFPEPDYLFHLRIISYQGSGHGTCSGSVIQFSSGHHSGDPCLINPVRFIMEAVVGEFINYVEENEDTSG